MTSRTKLLANKAMLLIVLIIFIISCKKENDENDYGLPKATQSGENTIGCLINGEPWQTDGIDFGDLIYAKFDREPSPYLGDIGFSLYAKYTSGFGPETVVEAFDININPILEATMHNKSNTEKFKIKYKERVPNAVETYINYYLDAQSNSYVEITKFDTTLNICSGAFEFRLIQEDNFDTLTVTEGRFDVTYYD